MSHRPLVAALNFAAPGRRLAPVALTLAVLIAAASAPVRAQTESAAPAVFEAPARDLPAGAFGRDPFARVLPSGRLLRPTGSSVVTGTNALGVALSPDGRFAIVTNDDERDETAVSALDPLTSGGFSLAVVDTLTMAVVSRYRDPRVSFFAGVVAMRDPARPSDTLVLASGGADGVVDVFDLSPAGALLPDAVRPSIATPGALDQAMASFGKSYPGPIVASPDGAHAYVSDDLGDDVLTIDVRARALAGRTPSVGFFPSGIAAAPGGIFVANEGLTTYARVATPALAPPLTGVAPNLDRASSLSIVPFRSDGTLPAAPLANLAMDPHPDGLRTVGGAHPSAVVAMRTKPIAFVAMTNVDRIATVAYGGGPPRVVGGTELRLFDRGPYGTQPTALALSPDESRLYVALAGVNAVAVLEASDARHLHRLGLIPTGWYPSSLALSADGHFLYVGNAKGIGEDVPPASGALWSTLEKIDLRTTNLRTTTPVTLANQRIAHLAAPSPVVPQYFGRGTSPVTHVVEIVEESKTYDAMLGDLTDAYGRPYGAGDPAETVYGTSVTPNLHALARTFGLAGNFYADAAESGTGHQTVLAGIATAYAERYHQLRAGRQPLAAADQEPEDYPRAGYLFNSLAARGRTFRDYGDLVRVAGYDEGRAADPRADDPSYAGPADQTAPTSSLGGLYSLDVPALGVLANHVDLLYPGYDARIRDVRRANEFLRDFDTLVRVNQVPAFTQIWLPGDGAGGGLPSPEAVADGDRALGKIVEYLTHLPQWANTAIFIEPASADGGRDHVDPQRTYAIVVSPYAKRHYVGPHHLSTVSVLKTEEELLGLPALSLGDALASDLHDFFAAEPDVTPYQQIDVPLQSSALPAQNGAAPAPTPGAALAPLPVKRAK